jgi:chemotaxis methyl-accepting protein methylase
LTPSSAERRWAHAELLDLLERRHGVGLRGAGVSAWMAARLDRALDALLADSAGDLSRALDLVKTDNARLEEVAELLRVGETRFFRDPTQWQSLRREVLPGFAGRDRIRALSVGCSTGEEAWSLAMLLAAQGSVHRVVGMDRSEAAVESARAGLYPDANPDHVPDDLATRYLQHRDGALRVADELRSSVSFVVRDAMIGPPPGHYEIVFCKNVLIYFGNDAAERAVQLLLRSLAEGGFLLVARSEVPRVKALGHAAEEIAPGMTVFRP